MTKALDTPLVRIVDDDAEQLKSLAFLLRMGGWEVMTYQSAAAFLEMDDPRRSGCLLLDHRMPNMTGMELHETLVERGSLLPVIFLSAHGDIPMAMQASGCGGKSREEKFGRYRCRSRTGGLSSKSGAPH